jgi:superfamily II DNA helicase RecQ
MRFRLFQYTLPAPPELEDLNAFLGSQRVASVSHQFVKNGGSAMLVFVVEMVTSPSAKGAAPNAGKIDYRELLTTEQFAVFSRLRDERKKWAEAEGVPVYTVFTNAQLADMVKRTARTTEDLRAIDGMGPARVDKYGARLLAILSELPATSDAEEKAP